MSSPHARSSSVLLVAAVAVAFALGGCKANEKYLCKSRQAEAKANLGAMSVAQKSYFAENKKYAATAAEAKFDAAGAKYYDIKIDSASATGFTATATGKGEAAGDVWTIDEKGTATPKNDLCK